MDAPLNPKVPAYKELISAKEIENKISKFAQELNASYRDQTLVLIAVLKGAVCFVVDLMRHLEVDVEVGFINASSYGHRGTKRGALTIQSAGDLAIEGKHVLVLDDIFDSGATLDGISTHLQKERPMTIKTAVLLAKKGTQITEFRPDYALFEIEDHFVIGYGLDHKEHFRQLPDICIWEES